MIRKKNLNCHHHEKLSTAFFSADFHRRKFFVYCCSNDSRQQPQKLFSLSQERSGGEETEMTKHKRWEKARVPMLLMTTININLWLDFFFIFHILYSRCCSLLSSHSVEPSLTPHKTTTQLLSLSPIVDDVVVIPIPTPCLFQLLSGELVGF